MLWCLVFFFICLLTALVRYMASGNSIIFPYRVMITLPWENDLTPKASAPHHSNNQPQAYA